MKQTRDGMSEKEVIGDCELYRADCMDILPTLQRFDACVTDPPYGIGENSDKVASRGKMATPKDYGSFDWDKTPISIDCLQAVINAGEWLAIFGGNYYALPATSCWLVWDKMNGKNDFADCELAWTNYPKAVRQIRWLWNGMIRQGNEERFHPTQKPLAVMAWAIDHAPKSDSVIDPFMGGGTTGVACAQTGRRFIGIERERQYFDIACERIERAYKQGQLFEPVAVKEHQEPLL